MTKLAKFIIVILFKGDEKEEYPSPAARESIVCWEILRRGNEEGSFGAGRTKNDMSAVPYDRGRGIQNNPSRMIPVTGSGF